MGIHLSRVVVVVLLGVPQGILWALQDCCTITTVEEVGINFCNAIYSFPCRKMMT